jgi:hypothetical protein
VPTDFSSGLGRFAFGPGRLLVDLLEQSVASLLGREIDVTFGDGRAHLTPRAVRFSPTPVGIATGRLDVVDVALDDVRWDNGRIDEMTLHARDVHVEPGFRSSLVASPVHVEARLGQAAVDEWLERSGVDWRVALANDGSVEVRWPGRERWGHAEFVPLVRNGRLRLSAEAVVVRGRRVSGPVQRYAPSVEVDIPPLPGRARVVGVRPAPGALHVQAVVDEVREPISARQLVQMRRAVAAFSGSSLVLPRR